MQTKRERKLIFGLGDWRDTYRKAEFDANDDDDDNVRNDSHGCNFLLPSNLKPIKPSSTSKLGLYRRTHTHSQ